MSQVLERERTEYRAPVRHRRRAVDLTLIAVGALAVLSGAYLQFAPSNWWLADLSEAYHLGSYVLGGVLLAAGCAIYADRALEEDGHGSLRTAAGMTVAIIALAGASLALLALV